MNSIIELVPQAKEPAFYTIILISHWPQAALGMSPGQRVLFAEKSSLKGKTTWWEASPHLLGHLHGALTSATPLSLNSWFAEQRHRCVGSPAPPPLHLCCPRSVEFIH